MKKNYLNKNFSSVDTKVHNDLLNPQIKTTNVNILLNRVKLEKKKTFNKNLLISFSLVFLISLLAVFLTIQS